MGLRVKSSCLNASSPLLISAGLATHVLLFGCSGSSVVDANEGSSPRDAVDSNPSAKNVPEPVAPPAASETAAAPADARPPTKGASAEDSTASSLTVADAGPLSDAQRAVFWGSTDDEVPEVLNAVKRENFDTHFLSSDELHQYVLAEKIEGIGGGYIGVGTDQCWLFMGWQKPSLAWLADYDRWVVALHWSYMAFFEHASSIDEFIRLWDRENRTEAIKILSKAYADREDRPLIIKVFREARHKVARRLRRIVSMGKRKRPTFLTDPEQFAFLKTMIEEGRVRPLVGNMLSDRGYSGMGESAKTLGVVIRHLYLSNAEDYWSYPDVFRSNMRGLPADERSVVSRARASKPINKDYRYMQQPLRGFIQWLDSGVDRSRSMWKSRPIEEDEFPYTWFTTPPS